MHQSFLKRLLIVLVLVSTSACVKEPRTADAQLKEALIAHGGLEMIEKSGVTVTLTGEFDLTTRLQGRSPNRAEPTPIHEVLHIGPSADWLVYDLDWFNYVTSNQNIREVHLEDRKLAFVNPKNGRGGYLPRQAVIDHKERLARIVPQLLINDAMENDAALADGQIQFASSHGQTLSLTLDKNSNLLRTASTYLELPVYGLAKIEWLWSNYEDDANGVWPTEFEIQVNGMTLKKSKFQVSKRTFDDPDLEALRINLGPPPDFQPYDDFVQHSEREANVEEVEDGVFLIRNLRPGFTLMFVDIGDSVVAIDAPADWFEMNQIPPLDWSQGMRISGLGQKYVRAIKATLPGKPISHLVLTHHHSDHIGGIEPFLDEGAVIVGGPEVLSLLQVSNLLPTDHSRIEVSDRFSLHGPNQRLDLISLPDGNPKADGYLMVFLPDSKILYTSAFIYPVPEAAFPPPESVTLSKYFVNWVDTSGLNIDTIYNVHGNVLVEEWHLEKIRKIDDSE